MIIAGDIGGTKTNLALFKEGDASFTCEDLKTYHSQKYPNLKNILVEYLQGLGKKRELITAACFAVAGPVREGVCNATNLPWVIELKTIAEALGIQNVFLINDLEANAHALSVLQEGQLKTLYEAAPIAGNRAVVSPGTGLGEAGLYFDGQSHHPFATEGGHVDFAPASDLQMELLAFLHKKWGHVSYERVLSGPGFLNLYHFFVQGKGREEPLWLKTEMQEKDGAACISENALSGKSELCQEILSLFVTILGQAVANAALKYMAVGGVFMGGGICPKIVSALTEKNFLEAYFNKGRFKALLEKIPLYLILDDKASLKGAASYAKSRSTKESFPKPREVTHHSQLSWAAKLLEHYLHSSSAFSQQEKEQFAQRLQNLGQNETALNTLIQEINHLQRVEPFAFFAVAKEGMMRSSVLSQIIYFQRLTKDLFPEIWDKTYKLWQSVESGKTPPDSAMTYLEGLIKEANRELPSDQQMPLLDLQAFGALNE